MCGLKISGLGLPYPFFFGGVTCLFMRFWCFQVRKCNFIYFPQPHLPCAPWKAAKSENLFSQMHVYIVNPVRLEIFRVYPPANRKASFPKHHFEGHICSSTEYGFLQTYSGSAMYRQIAGDVYSELGQNFKTTNPINHQTPAKIRLVQLLHGKFHHSLNVPVSKIN